MIMVPDDAGPRGPGGQPLAMRPHYESWSEPCPERYHEGLGVDVAAAELCACGTFAIGRCLDCNRPVCGDCSTIRSGRRACRDCRSRQDRATAAAAAPRRQALEKERAEAAAKKAADVAAAKAAHAEKVRTREASAGAMSAAEVDRRRDEILQIIRKNEHRGFSTVGGSFLTAVFICFVAITLAYFVGAAIAGGDDAAKARILAPMDIAIVVIVLGLWVRQVASRSSSERLVTAMKRELSELPFKRGCGDRSCSHCYVGAGQ